LPKRTTQFGSIESLQTNLPHLLSKLAVTYDSKDLNSAMEHVSPSLLADRPVEWVQQVISDAGIPGVRPIQLGWRRFDQRLLPALIYHDSHWYLAERIDAETISLHSADEAVEVVAEELLQNATVIWLRAPANKQPKSFSFKGNLAAQLLWKEIFREPRWLGSILIATLIVNFIAVGTSLFAMQVYDRVVPTQAYATLTTLVAGMGLVVLLDWFLKMIRARILDSMACAVDKRTSQQLFDHLLHLQLDRQPQSLGTLAAQISGLDSVRQFFSAALVFALLDMPFALMFIAMIWVIGGAVSLVYLCLLPVALVLGYITQRRMRRLMREQLMRHHERQGILVDSIRGAESIRAASATWRFSQQWEAITASIDGFNIQQKAIASFSNVSTSSLSTAAYVSAIVVGVFEIGAGNLTMGGLIACSILGGRVIAPMAQAVQYLSQWQNVEQSLQMVNQVLMLPKERRDEQELLLPHELPNTLDLEKVRFAYPQSPVQQINIPKLTFKAGERVLLLGTIGSGKSTLLKVLAGLFRPNEGRIRLGSGDLWEMDPKVVSSHLSYLPQVVHLFKGTLRSNLTLSGTASDSRLLHITRELGVDAIAASNLMGMDLPISEGGDGLSGGQRQLVALARVLINQPRIWILDEPTSSLDGDSEKNVWRVLEENIGKDDILVVATHRPMQAMNLATRVIVMNEGEVVRDGKPASILPQLFAGSAKPQKAIPAGGMPNVV